MERRKFTREYKLEAVRLIKNSGVSYVQASQDLGVHTSQLRDWVKKFADDPEHAFPGQGQMKPEQLEIARLKREVIKLKAERDILKKAAAYFDVRSGGSGDASAGESGTSWRSTCCSRLRPFGSCRAPFRTSQQRLPPPRSPISGRPRVRGASGAATSRLPNSSRSARS